MNLEMVRKTRRIRLPIWEINPGAIKNPAKNELLSGRGGLSRWVRPSKGVTVSSKLFYHCVVRSINTAKAKMADILKNEEINTMIYTIGAGVGSDFTLEDVNYDKIIIMTDADTDGAHIQTHCLTFFYRYMRTLVEAGRVYIALPPLYKMSKRKGKTEKIAYAWSDGELEICARILAKDLPSNAIKVLVK